MGGSDCARILCAAFPRRQAAGQLLHARLTADYKGYVGLEREDHREAVAQARLVIAAVAEQIDKGFPQLDTGEVARLAAGLG